MRPDELDYPLPKDLIAQRPLAERDTSRLLVARRSGGEIEDRSFADLAGIIPSGDVLVLNDTRVFPARLLGRKKGTGGKVDLLLLGEESPGLWRCLAQPALREGQRVELEAGVEAEYRGRGRDDVPRFIFEGTGDVREWASRHGHVPLPPYIKREDDPADRADYQTVFAENEGAVAAPTAGLHFTERLLECLRANGVAIEKVTLHVGYGTFRPVEDLEGHRMHAEAFELKPDVAERLNAARAAGKGLWAVGTTVCRVLETCVQKKRLVAGKGETDLYIRAPFRFEAVDHLITNFHLPKTSLLVLVSAFMGEALRKKSYDHAIAEKYRFYSFGDAMAIV